jgi:hypothetical protein
MACKRMAQVVKPKIFGPLAVNDAFLAVDMAIGKQKNAIVMQMTQINKKVAISSDHELEEAREARGRIVGREGN